MKNSLNNIIRILDSFDYRDFKCIVGYGNRIPLVFKTSEIPQELLERTEIKKYEGLKVPPKYFHEDNLFQVLDLFNFKSIIKAPILSKLDCDFGTDFLVQLPNSDIWLAIQTKSSLKIIKKILNSEIPHYNCVSEPLYIFWDSGNRKSRIKELISFFSVLGVTLKVAPKKEDYELIKKLAPIYHKDIPKYEYLKPGITKKLKLMYLLGELMNNGHRYDLVSI